MINKSPITACNHIFALGTQYEKQIQRTHRCDLRDATRRWLKTKLTFMRGG